MLEGINKFIGGINGRKKKIFNLITRGVSTGKRRAFSDVLG